MKTSLTRHGGAHSHQEQGAFQAKADPNYLILSCNSSADIRTMKLCSFSILRFLMVFSHHQLLGRGQQFPWRHLWPILLKYSSFPGNNSQYDQNQISLPILMYYIWDLQPKNKGWHKKGEKRARRKRKIEEPSSGLIWQMQSRKRAAAPAGVEKLDRMIFFYYYYISLDADLSD